MKVISDTNIWYYLGKDDLLYGKVKTEPICPTFVNIYEVSKSDNNKIDSLYPMTSFDELTIKKLPFGFKKTLTNEQTTKFLEIINDPVSFDWGETTYEPGFQVDFFKNRKVVASFTIGADKSIMKTNPD